MSLYTQMQYDGLRALELELPFCDRDVRSRISICRRVLSEFEKCMSCHPNLLSNSSQGLKNKFHLPFYSRSLQKKGKNLVLFVKKIKPTDYFFTHSFIFVHELCPCIIHHSYDLLVAFLI